MELQHNTGWSEDIEAVLRAIHLNCNQYADRHTKQYVSLKGYIKYFRIPTLVVSGVSSVLSVGLQPFLVQKYVSVITCVSGLFCAILASIELYLQLQTSIDSELIASKQFQLLAADIFKTLTLKRENRGIGGVSYLDDKFSMFCKYIDSSQLVTTRIRDSLKYGDPKAQRSAINQIALAVRSISQSSEEASKSSEGEASNNVSSLSSYTRKMTPSLFSSIRSSPRPEFAGDIEFSAVSGRDSESHNRTDMNTDTDEQEPPTPDPCGIGDLNTAAATAADYYAGRRIARNPSTSAKPGKSKRNISFSDTPQFGRTQYSFPTGPLKPRNPVSIDPALQGYLPRPALARVPAHTSVSSSPQNTSALDANPPKRASSKHAHQTSTTASPVSVPPGVLGLHYSTSAQSQPKMDKMETNTSSAPIRPGESGRVEYQKVDLVPPP